MTTEQTERLDSNKERLLGLALIHWGLGESVPLDLFCEMLNEGLDVMTLEGQHLS